MMLADGDCTHCPLCMQFGTNGSNHWILRHLTRSVKLKPWPGGHKVLFSATSDRLSQSSNKGWKSHRKLFGILVFQFY